MFYMICFIAGMSTGVYVADWVIPMVKQKMKEWVYKDNGNNNS